MAPEQEQGEPIPLSDVYGLGATLVALARGEEYKGVKTAQDLEGYVEKMTHLSEGFRHGMKDMFTADVLERGKRWILQDGKYEWRKGEMVIAGDETRDFPLFLPALAGITIGFTAPAVYEYAISGSGLKAVLALFVPGMPLAFGLGMAGCFVQIFRAMYHDTQKSQRAASLSLSQPISKPTKSIHIDAEGLVEYTDSGVSQPAVEAQTANIEEEIQDIVSLSKQVGVNKILSYLRSRYTDDPGPM